MNRASYRLQKWLYALILHGDILVNRFGLEAIVFLVLIFEFPSTFRAFPHNDPSLLPSYHAVAYKSILCHMDYTDSTSAKRVVISL